MTTIPARRFVNIIPGVLAPAGNALDAIGLMLTTSRRVPVGTVQSFASAPSVESFFGGGSVDATLAPYYFDGFVNASALPGAMLIAQYPITGMPAWLQGGNVSSLTIPEIQAISGTLDVTIDGFAYSASSLTLAAATSFSSAAGIIETALNASPPSGGTSTTSTIAEETSTFTASIAGNVMYVTSVPSVSLVPGGIVTGTGVVAGTQIENQLNGTAGGIGTYAVSQTQTVASASLTSTWGLLTIGGTVGGQSYGVGQTISGTGVTSGTQITALGTGTGGAGTYIVSPEQTVASTAIDSNAPDLVVSFDSVSGGFVITSGMSGPAAGVSTASFATGTTAASLALTQATGATLSNGGLPETPSTFMDAVAAINSDWFSFFTNWDPDGANGAVGQNVQKMAFAQWTSQQQDTPFAYIVEDTDISPSTQVPAASSMGQLLKAQSLSGTSLIWNPNGATAVNSNPFGSRAAFVSGCGGSVNFEETNGRITFAFKTSPAGLSADVTSDQVAVNLGGNPQNADNGQPVGGNGYNYYGAVANAATNWIYLYPGSVSGPFAWLDAFLNQAYFNAQMQEDVLNLMTQIKSFPYNPGGYGLLESSLGTTIEQMLNFGAAVPNVDLSSSQIAQINQATGVNAAPILQNRGWYLQIKPASASVRAARGSPPAVFYYTDGGSIQAFALNSIDVM